MHNLFLSNKRKEIELKRVIDEFENNNMKIKHVITTLALAGLMGAGAFAGIKASGLKEARADDVYTYYLTGSFNDWSTDKTKCVELVSYKTNEVKVLGYEFTGNNTFKALKFKNGNFDSWMGNITGTGSGSNQIGSASGINVYASNNNAGIHYNNDTGTRPFNVIYNYSTNHFYVDYAYKMTVGSSNFWMEPNPDNDSELHGKGTGSAGDTVSVTYFTDENPGTINLGKNDKPSNNLTGSKTLKVDGQFDFYMLRSNWSDAWATGYAPSSQNLEALCNAILTLDCDSKALPTDKWDACNGTEKEAFRDATALPGNGKTTADYGSVLVEAKTRYELLVAKGATPFEMPALSSASTATANNTNYVPVIIIVSSIALVSVLGAALMIKRRKEDR